MTEFITENKLNCCNKEIHDLICMIYFNTEFLKHLFYKVLYRRCYNYVKVLSLYIVVFILQNYDLSKIFYCLKENTNVYGCHAQYYLRIFNINWII